MLKRNWRVVYTLLVIVGDLVLLNAAFRFALWLRFPEMDNPLMQYWEPICISPKVTNTLAGW